PAVRIRIPGGPRHLTGPELKQASLFLFCGAPAHNQLYSDLGSRSKRTNSDIAAREFLRDNAHRLLAKPEAAIALRYGEAEHPKLRHLRNDVERDIAVGAMPLLCLRCDLAVGKLAHLLADGSQRLVQAAVADCGILMAPHALDQACAVPDIQR